MPGGFFPLCRRVRGPQGRGTTGFCPEHPASMSGFQTTVWGGGPDLEEPRALCARGCSPAPGPGSSSVARLLLTVSLPLSPPQLWDIRRKGCVFRYRVRTAPPVAHSLGTSQTLAGVGAADQLW